MRGVFVTGTDTGIGKTLVSAWLARGWGAEYWKPIQTGIAEGLDADTVARLAGVRVHPGRWLLRAPLSPHLAARRDGVTITLDDFALPRTDRPLVVEGAGGVLVPLDDAGTMMAGLIARLGLPVVVVARGGLGTINHTLLTLEALRARGLEPAGVVLNGPLGDGNLSAVETFGRVRVLGAIPPLGPQPSLEGLAPPPALESLA
ncbi:MAG: dethiobiotin synthase [Alphaproteobacteria bacterium]|nr:dethiobiotin synthase [Alphaproteobacteria bacterium]